MSLAEDGPRDDHPALSGRSRSREVRELEPGLTLVEWAEALAFSTLMVRVLDCDCFLGDEAMVDEDFDDDAVLVETIHLLCLIHALLSFPLSCSDLFFGPRHA